MGTFCCQAPIAGEMCRSCRCTSDCGYFLPLLTSVAEKPTNDFFKMKDTTFPFSHLQQLFSFDKNLCLKWRRKLVQYYSFSYFKQFFSCPGSFYTLVVFVVRIWTQFILQTNRHFRNVRPFIHLIRVMSGQNTKRQKIENLES